MYDSRIDWDVSGIDKEMFLACVGDNVFDTCDGEDIDWKSAISDFEAAMKEKRNAA